MAVTGLVAAPELSCQLHALSVDTLADSTVLGCVSDPLQVCAGRPECDSYPLPIKLSFWTPYLCSSADLPLKAFAAFLAVYFDNGQV